MKVRKNTFVLMSLFGLTMYWSLPTNLRKNQAAQAARHHRQVHLLLQAAVHHPRVPARRVPAALLQVPAVHPRVPAAALLQGVPATRAENMPALMYHCGPA